MCMFKLSVAVFCVNATQTAVEFYCWHVKKKQKKHTSSEFVIVLPQSARNNNTLYPSHSLEKFVKNFTLLFISPHSFLLWEHVLSSPSKTIHSQRLPHKGEFNEHLFAPGDNLVASWRQQSTSTVHVLHCPYLAHPHTHTHWIALSHLWWILNLQLNPLMRLPAFPESIVITLNCF